MKKYIATNMVISSGPQMSVVQIFVDQSMFDVIEINACLYTIRKQCEKLSKTRIWNMFLPICSVGVNGGLESSIKRNKSNFTE